MFELSFDIYFTIIMLSVAWLLAHLWQKFLFKKNNYVFFSSFCDAIVGISNISFDIRMSWMNIMQI